MHARRTAGHQARGPRSPGAVGIGPPWGDSHLERPLSRGLYIIDEEQSSASAVRTPHCLPAATPRLRLRHPPARTAASEMGCL